MQGESPTQARAQLGRLLFFDPVLSRDGDLSCAHCHRPEHAFSDALVARLRAIPECRERFASAFADEPRPAIDFERVPSGLPVLAALSSESAPAVPASRRADGRHSPSTPRRHP